MSPYSCGHPISAFWGLAPPLKSVPAVTSSRVVGSVPAQVLFPVDSNPNSWRGGNPNSLVALKPTLFPVRLQLPVSAGCWFPHRLSPRVGPQMHLGLNFHDAAQEGTREAHRTAGGRGRSRSSLQVLGEEGGGRAARTRHLAAVESRTACGVGVRGSGPGVREEQMVRRRDGKGAPAAAKSRAVARTVTMATEEGGARRASHFSRT